MMRGLPYLFSTLIVLLAWWAVSWLMGPRLVPPPSQSLAALFETLSHWQAWADISLTIFRGLSGLVLSVAAALVLGVPAGLSRRTMELISPLVAALQACPPVIWVSLLMVWLGSGSTVTLGVIFASLFPLLFANVAQAVAGLDKRLFQMARVYRAGRVLVLKAIVLPGIYPFFLAGLSYALGTCWKVTAVAEFLGSPDGMGARIYWAYRMLDMPVLFAWAALLVGLGMVLELGLVRPLRRAAERRRGHNA